MCLINGGGDGLRLIPRVVTRLLIYLSLCLSLCLGVYFIVMLARELDEAMRTAPHLFKPLRG